MSNNDEIYARLRAAAGRGQQVKEQPPTDGEQPEQGEQPVRTERPGDWLRRSLGLVEEEALEEEASPPSFDGGARSPAPPPAPAPSMNIVLRQAAGRADEFGRTW